MEQFELVHKLWKFQPNMQFFLLTTLKLMFLLGPVSCKDSSTSIKIHTVTVTLPYRIDDRDCWSHCGRKGGLCSWCGDNGYCCRLNWEDCPELLSNVGLPNHHTCIRNTPGNGVNKKLVLTRKIF